MTDLTHSFTRQATKRSFFALILIALTAIAVLVVRESGTRSASEPFSEGEWRPVVGDHWAAVAKLVGGASDQYFVLIDVHYLMSAVALEEAGRALCKSTICDIGFFADAEDVPSETSSTHFLNGGGWTTSGEVAHYFEDTVTRERQIKWDCDFARQLFLEYCLRPPHSTLSQGSIIASRLPLLGFGGAKFGMSLAELKIALSEHLRIWMSRPATPVNINILQTTDPFGGLVFSSFYNVVDGQFRSVALVMSEKLAEAECFQYEQRIAAWVDRKYGKRDQFSYYDETQTSNEFLWRFSNAAQISLTNLAPKGGGCVLRLTFEDKPSE